MSVLELSGRPFVVFDPKNEEHRGFYFDFVQTGAWGRCPYRFVIPEDHGNQITMIQRALVKYYVEAEFAPTKKRVRRVVKKQQNNG